VAANVIAAAIRKPMTRLGNGFDCSAPVAVVSHHFLFAPDLIRQIGFNSIIYRKISYIWKQ
jgi:hypothetical protein